MLLFLLFVIISTFGYSSQDNKANKYRVCKNRFYNETLPLSKLAVRSRLECSRACEDTELCKSSMYSRVKGSENCILFLENLSGYVCSDMTDDAQHDVISQKMVSPCNYNQPFVAGVCNCGPGFTGTFCEFPPRDCQDFGSPPPSAYYDVYPWFSEDTITVYCYLGYIDLCENPGDPGALFLTSLWNDYKAGFGVVFGDSYWLGNENIHRITHSPYKYVLRLNAKERAIGTVHRSTYNEFWVDNEANRFAIHFTTMNIDPDVTNMLHPGLQFRTPDFNDDGCASTYGTGFWYESGCPFTSPLMGWHPYSGVPGDTEYFWMEIMRM